jgi:hypothetical protein
MRLSYSGSAAEARMGYFVARLKRPYDYRALIEAYIYTQRKDFVHSDFTKYYASLLEALQKCFGIRLSREGLSFNQVVLWGLFQSSVWSLLQITSPWAGYLEAGLLYRKLEESGEPGRVVDKASRVIGEANKASEVAHREILDALFQAIFGECQRVVTSEDLREAGLTIQKSPTSSTTMTSFDWRI